MDVFAYAHHFIHQLVRSYEPAHPLQIELHPGLHCDRYQCPHCFGYGQRPLAGRVLSVEEIARALDEVRARDPFIVVSGVTTEPLTHPEAAALLAAVRSRGFRLGLYTKGLRFNRDCSEAVLLGNAECSVTFSLDAFDKQSYQRLHGIQPGGGGRGEGTKGEDYFDKVVANIRAFHEEKCRRGSRVQIRIAILLFAENCGPDLEAAIAPYAAISDLVRLAIAQDRNDGHRLGNLPNSRAMLLGNLSERFAKHPKIRVLTQTAEPARDRAFRRCHTQRFQVTIDKSGNLFPCPQVAVAPYRHLSFGNLHSAPLQELLRSEQRRAMFAMDIDDQMRCRICDRKDEAINRTLDRLEDLSFPSNPIFAV
jgi:radical SAM protein with 4Fe4S-binding SPASM domain